MQSISLVKWSRNLGCLRFLLENAKSPSFRDRWHREMAAQYNMANMYIVYNAEAFKLLLDYFNISLWHTHTFFNDMFTWKLYIYTLWATQRHVSAKYSMTRYTYLRLTSCSRKLGLLDTPKCRAFLSRGRVDGLKSAATSRSLGNRG